ncbi:MAG: 30S ribosomal protein S16 [Patescibacteria group bacterium]
MLTIRLSRIGKKNAPLFRLIAVDRHKDPWGTNLEILGNYNPKSKETNLKVERLQYWISKGAQCSNSVFNLLVTNKVLEGKKKNVSTVSDKRKEKLAKGKAK